MALPILAFVLVMGLITLHSFEYLMWAYLDPAKGRRSKKPHTRDPLEILLMIFLVVLIILGLLDAAQQLDPDFTQNHPRLKLVFLTAAGLTTVPMLLLLAAWCFLRFYNFRRHALHDLGLGSTTSSQWTNEAAKMQIDGLLPAEKRYQNRFETILLFKHGHDEFPFDKALQEYHREPIHFALALAELNTGLFTATSASGSSAARIFQRKLRAKRRNRDVIGQDVDEYLYENIHGMSYIQHWRYRKAKVVEFLEARTERHLEEQDAEHLAKWETQFQNFYDNVRAFCKHTGSEVDDLAPPRETINNLRKFASNRRQELAPLLEENARLNQQLTRYKRINAALQTRHTIEKLVFQLPKTKAYKVSGSGPKWQALWTRIWADASTNASNPFHKLWTDSTGAYARKNIENKGLALFADMSGEIHGYDQTRPNTFDYEHFDASARKVAMILHENQIVDQNTGDVDWGREIGKYPVV